MTKKMHYLRKSALFGLASLALYGVVFSQSDFVMKYWTKGGIYALLPVATVFLFSYVHGSCAANFWSALGIEGSQKVNSSSKEKSSRREQGKREKIRAQVQL